MIKYCVKSGLLGLCLSVAMVSQAGASESVIEIAKQSQNKEMMIRVMQERMIRHQKMPLEEIREELRTALEKNQAEYARMGKSSSETNYVFQRALVEVNRIDDKDLLIAQESAELQNLVSAKNILFILTRDLVRCMLKGDTADVFFGTFFLFITVPIDLATLPITLLGSLVTGF